MKQQFNVYLEPELVSRVKHAAIDASLSLSAFVTSVFEQQLDPEESPMSVPLTLQPIVRVAGALPEAIRFYEALGGTVVVRSRDNDFALIRVGGAEIALLAHPPNPDEAGEYVELAFATDEPLVPLEAALRAKGVTIARGAADEAFGEQLQVESPDGMLIKINRLEQRTFS